MPENNDDTPETPPEVVGSILEQAETLCQQHDHITRVIAGLDFPDDAFNDQYNKPSPFEFEGMLRVLLYREITEMSYREVERRCERWAYLLMRFELDRPPRQQTMTYTRRQRISFEDWQLLAEVAAGIRKIAADHDLVHVRDEAPPITPDEIQDGGLTEDEIRRAVRLARKRVFKPFTSHRAENAKHDDEVIWELQAYLSMVRCGTAQGGRRFARLSGRSETPHGDTHARAVKKMGNPDPQTMLNEWVGVSTIQNWRRIRKRLLDPFDAAIDRLFEETDLDDAITEPVNVAIDITPWEFYPSPWEHSDLSIPKDDYPALVSGLKEPHQRGYEFATLSIVGRDTPLVLAVEPVKRQSEWEDPNADTTPLANVVERLLSKAQRHVDIHKVFADREFDTHRIRHLIDRKGMTYLIPKRLSANADLEAIDRITEHPTADIAVEPDVPLTVDGRTHEVNFMYLPSESGSGHAIFTTNSDDVPPERVRGLVAQYRDRWMIENEYKVVKSDFLPVTCSTDYRMRLFYFIAAILMYNLWRVTNLILRESVDVHLGESPPLTAGEVAELLAVLSDTGFG